MANTHSLDLELSSSEYAYAADSTSLSITGDMTVECWVKLESAPSATTMYFITKEDADNSKISYQFGYGDYSGTKRLFASISQDGANRDLVRQTYTLTPGTWYHFAVTVDVSNAVASEFEFFINGSSVGNGSTISDSSCTAIHDNNSQLQIGNRQSGATGYYDGLIDDVRIWNDIRTSGEISGNYQSELGGAESGLVAYYKFNNSLLDETTNNNDLTHSGTATYSTTVPFVGATDSSAFLAFM